MGGLSGGPSVAFSGSPSVAFSGGPSGGCSVQFSASPSVGLDGFCAGPSVGFFAGLSVGFSAAVRGALVFLAAPFCLMEPVAAQKKMLGQYFSNFYMTRQVFTLNSMSVMKLIPWQDTALSTFDVSG
jgi:hypothetical protein